MNLIWSKGCSEPRLLKRAIQRAPHVARLEHHGKRRIQCRRPTPCCLRCSRRDNDLHLKLQDVANDKGFERFRKLSRKCLQTIRRQSLPDLRQLQPERDQRILEPRPNHINSTAMIP